MTSRHLVVLLVSALAAPSCSSIPAAAPNPSGLATATTIEPATISTSPTGSATPTTTASSTSTAPVSQTTVEPTADLGGEPLRTGARVLVDDDFAVLERQRVGLIANHTAVVGDRHLVDLLHEAPTVDLVAVFAPEHGFRGSGDAGEVQDDAVDPATGVTVYSIYGDTKKPTPAMLEGIDVLVYDIQDVGTRFYTYISTLGLAMQAAAEAGIEVVVLDRPNPNPGPSAGPILEPAQRSFIGQYEIPSAYGLTVGELALAIKDEGWIDGVSDLDLSVVGMTGWDPGQHWDDLVDDTGGGVAWVAPSPGLPTVDGARLYPGMVLFEATTLAWGRGTDAPFEQVGAPWLDATAVASRLNGLAATTPELAGASFEATTFTPKRLPYMTSEPQFSGVAVPAVRVHVDDTHAIEPVALGVYLLAEIIQSAPDHQIIDRGATFDLLAGNTSLRSGLLAGTLAPDIVATWRASSLAFDNQVTGYRLYGDDTD